jgi:uroporphyrinogen decarboxylase
MNSRERVRLALQHKEPDRIPFDLGGTVMTSIHKDAYGPLRALLGLPTRDHYPILEFLQQIVVIDEDIRELLKADVRDAAARSSGTFNIEIKDMGDYTYFYDEWGIGWRMPKVGGFFYDMFDHPLKAATTVADIDNFAWPNPTDPARFVGLRERARHLAEVEGKAVTLGGLCAGILEMAAWTRGYENFYPDCIVNVPLIERICDIVLDMKMAYWEKALAEVGDYADVVIEADDFAGQFHLLISLDMYRKLFKPRHKKLFDFIHARTEAKIFFHSCGAIRPAIPDLIDVGVDILNPVQVSAAGMDSAELKREFGRDLAFWGGGVDVQGVFGTGTPAQVRDDVKRRIDDLAPGGGLIFATVHNTQANVPPENFVAMWDTLQEFGAYR